MEHNVRALPPELLVQRLPELLEDAQAVPLIISGSSMSPFLVHGRDTVYLSKVTGPLKRGDMIFYRRASGACVLHRICAVEGETYSLVGDAQSVIERGIRRGQVMAMVTAVSRKGKLLQKGCFWWDFFEKVWLRLIPARRLLVRLYSFFRGGRNGENAHD